MEEEVTFDGILCQRCQLELDEPFICTRVECLHVLCSICRVSHDHSGDVVRGEHALDTVRPYIDRYRKSIRECLNKAISRRAKAEFEMMTRLDKSAEVKRDIKTWCSKMHSVINEAETTLLNTVEVMEDEYSAKVESLIKELKGLEKDYNCVNDLKTAFNSKELDPKQAFKLYTLMKKHEDTLRDPSKTSEKKLWEQTYLGFIPNEQAMVQLKSTAYICGKIKSNIQLSIDTQMDKSTAGLSGMTLVGDRLAVADKYNRCVKLFTRPLHCGLGGEAAETSVIDQYKEGEESTALSAPENIVFDPVSNLIIITCKQENCVLALDPEDATLNWKLEMKHPNLVAVNDKLIIVCSEYEKSMMTFKKSNQKKADSILLKDHTLSIAANNKKAIALCSLRGKMEILNTDLKLQHELKSEIDSTVFRPQRVCSMYNDRFLACDTQRVVEIEPNGVVKRTILIAGAPGTSIPEVPSALACDQNRNIFMGFGKYVKVFPVPLEIVPPDEEITNNNKSENDMVIK